MFVQMTSFVKDTENATLNGKPVFSQPELGPDEITNPDHLVRALERFQGFIDIDMNVSLFKRVRKWLRLIFFDTFAS